MRGSKEWGGGRGEGGVGSGEWGEGRGGGVGVKWGSKDSRG